MEINNDTAAPTAIRLNKADNIIVALCDFIVGDRVDILNNYELKIKITRGHKVAACDIKNGENIFRYGQIIGVANKDIAFGDHVHSHNCIMGDHAQDYAHATANTPLAIFKEEKTFQGFKREDGRVGTRNYIGIITSVNCSGTVARLIAEQVEKSDWFRKIKKY